MHPIFRVSTVEGAITGPGGRALSLTVVDESGKEADRAMIEVDDRNGELQVPPGAEITVEMGYEETGLFFMGTFKIEKITLAGWPQTMQIEASGVDMAGGMKVKGDQDHHNKDVEQVVKDEASPHGLKVKVDAQVGAHQYKYLLRSKESPNHFLTRIALRHDCVFKVANGTVIFVKRGMGMSATGVGLTGGLARYPDNVKGYVCELTAAPMYSDGATQGWNDTRKAEQETEEAPALPTPNPLRGTPGSGGSSSQTKSGGSGGAATGSSVGGGIAAAAAEAVAYNISTPAADGPTEAQDTSKGKADQQGRLEGKLNIVIIGDPTVFAETPLQVENVRDYVDGEWNITKVQHRIDGSGFTTYIEAEYPGSGGNGAGTDSKGWNETRPGAQHALGGAEDTGGHAPAASESAGV